MFRSFRRARGTTKKLESFEQLEGLDELETPDLKHLSVLLRHERARGCRSGASVASGAVAPNIAEAAANIIGLDTSLEPDAELLECEVCTHPTFGVHPAYSALSAAYAPLIGNKRMAEWSSECIVPVPHKAPRLVGTSTLPSTNDVTQLAWAPPPVEEVTPGVAIVTPLFVERSLDDLPPAVWMEPLVHDAGQPDAPLHDKFPIMIDAEDVAVRDNPLMLRASPNPDGRFEAENWWTSAGYFAHAEHFARDAETHSKSP